MKVSKPGPKRILLFVLLFAVPFGALYFLSKAHHDFGEPPYIGPVEYVYDDDGNVIDSQYYQIPDFTFTDLAGNRVDKNTLEGEYIIFTTIQNDCVIADEMPGLCSVYPYHIQELLYKEFHKNKPSFGDVTIVSIITDSLGQPVKPTEELRHFFDQFDSEIWKLVEGDPKQVYDFPISEDSTYTQKRKSGYLGNRPYLRTMLLVDKNHHIRGFFGGKTQAEIREFKDRLRVLKKVDKTTKEN